MEKISRATLARYAAVLGRGSIAARALALFDHQQRIAGRPIAFQTNNGFVVEGVTSEGERSRERFGC